MCTENERVQWRSVCALRMSACSGGTDMVVLVIGGSGSGKSAYAEARAAELFARQKPEGRLVYLATMEVRDEESRQRVARHRQMRKEKQFVTVECPTHLEEAAAGPGDTFLLECISNLTANEMYAPGGRGVQAAEVIAAGIRRLARTAEHLVLVGNHVFADGADYDASTTEYLRQMAQIQQEAASLADEVVEVVCGIPLMIKSVGDKRCV